jgi:hypothetical protein
LVKTHREARLPKLPFALSPQQHHKNKTASPKDNSNKLNKSNSLSTVASPHKLELELENREREENEEVEKNDGSRTELNIPNDRKPQQ